MKASNITIVPRHINYGKSIVLVGYEMSNLNASPFTFLVLTMDQDILPVNISKELVNAAHLDDMKVVFIPTLDLLHVPKFISTKDQFAILDIVASHASDDVKTAVLAGYGKIESTVDYQYDALAYTCNQIICGVKWHAEAILAEYLKVIELKPKSDLWWLMILEPCHSCLLDMTKSDAAVIAYLTDHKAKWNTDEYLRLKTYLQRPDRYVKTIYTKETILE